MTEFAVSIRTLARILEMLASFGRSPICLVPREIWIIDVLHSFGGAPTVLNDVILTNSISNA